MKKDKIFRGKKGHIYHNRESFHANELPYETIMGKPGVVFAKAGTKIKNGIDTGIPCIVVGVITKKPKKKLKTSELVPASLSDGTITDVIETPEVFAGAAPYTDKYRPVPGGVSGIIAGGSACTIGLLVKDTTDDAIVALTCNHCCGLKYDPAYTDPITGNLAPEGTTFLQPSPVDGGVDPDDKIGEVKRCVAIKFGATNYVDAGITSIASPVTARNGIFSLDNGPFTFGADADYEVGTQIYKVGRTSGKIIDDHIVAKNVAVNVNYGQAIAYFTNTIEYSHSVGGDSGAAVLISSNESGVGGPYKVIGINFAGGTGTGFATPIETIATDLGIEAWPDGTWSPDIVVASNASPVIRVNGQCYSRVEDTSDPVTHIAEANCADGTACSLTLDPTGDRYWVGGTGYWIDSNHWAKTSGGIGGYYPPTEINDTFFDENSASDDYTVTMPYQDYSYCRNFTMDKPSGTGKKITWAGNTVLSVYGNFDLVGGVAGIAMALLGNILFKATTGTQTFDTNGVSLPSSVFAFWPTGSATVQALSDVTLTSASAQLMRLGNAFDANGKTITMSGAGAYSVVSGFSGASALHKLILIGTTNAEAVTFENNTDLTDIIEVIGSKTLKFTDGITTTLADLIANGTIGNEVIIRSTGTGTHTLVKTGGGIINCTHLDIQHSIATPANTWYAYGSIDHQSIASAGSGWIINGSPVSPFPSYRR